MAWLILILLLAGPLPGMEIANVTPVETVIITSLIGSLDAPTWQAREDAFFRLQVLGQRAVPFLKAARSGADFQTRLKLDYLINHVPIFQEEIPVQAVRARIGTGIARCENPEREVLLRPFRIDKYEVTQFMYYVFLKATGHPAPPDWLGGRYPVGEENYPITGIGFLDAQAYAKWAGKRLPTADEWEYAARGPDGLLLPWGDASLKRVANIDNMRTFQRAVVGSYPKDKSPLGLMDMAGNVSEWVVIPSAEGDIQAVKGSAFNKAWREPFIYLCYMALPKAAHYTSRDTGFRCAK